MILEILFVIKSNPVMFEYLKGLFLCSCLLLQLLKFLLLCLHIFYVQWRLFVEGIFLAVSIFSLSHIDKKVKYHSRVPSLILSRVTLKNGQACFENLGALTAQDF